MSDEEKAMEEYEKWCVECCSEYCGDDSSEIMGDELCPGCLCSDMCEELRYELGEDVDDDWEYDEDD